MTTRDARSFVRLALPKGRMQEGVFSLLAEAGIKVRAVERTYRPSISLPEFEVKILKPQNIIEMLHAGSRDIGFAGEDWVRELNADLVELVDTRLDPVRLVAAAPRTLLVDKKLPKQPLIIASEYENITRRWIEQENLDATFIRSYGATEVFPPEDADCIVDNTATGETLRANGLDIVAELTRSSTRLYASPHALENPERRQRIEDFVLLVRSVLQARERVMLEVNVAPEQLEAVIANLPCMKRPTVSELYGETGYAVKGAVLKKDLPRIIPQIKACGGSDIVVTAFSQIVP